MDTNQEMSSKTVVFRSGKTADNLLRVIQKCVDDNNGPLFTVGLSGGSLPQVLAQVLPQLTTDWNKWKFFFCDERLVPFEDPDSTFGAYRKQLSARLPQLRADQWVTIDPKLNSDQSAKDYANKMREVFGEDTLWPRFDLLLLGMGPDGHTCSLFPNHALLKEWNQWVAAITDSPKPPPNRITFTLPVLNNAKCCVFYSTGAGKAQVLKDILVERKPLPAGLVSPTAGVLYWILDSESGGLIPEQMITEETIV